MSLEATIAENTAAIRELIAKLSAGAIVSQDVATDKPAATKTTKEATGTTKKDAAQSSESTPTVSDNSKSSSKESAQADTKEKPEHTEQSTAPTYQDAAAAITRLSKEQGRDAAVGLLKEFEAKTLKDVAPEDFAKLIAQADKAMAAVEA